MEKQRNRKEKRKLILCLYNVLISYWIGSFTTLILTDMQAPDWTRQPYRASPQLVAIIIMDSKNSMRSFVITEDDGQNAKCTDKVYIPLYRGARFL